LVCLGLFIFKCVPPEVEHDDKLPTGNINKTVDNSSLLAGERLYDMNAEMD